MSHYPYPPCLLLEEYSKQRNLCFVKPYLQEFVKQYREKLFVPLFIKLVSKNTHRVIFF